MSFGECVRKSPYVVFVKIEFKFVSSSDSVHHIAHLSSLQMFLNFTLKLTKNTHTFTMRLTSNVNAAELKIKLVFDSDRRKEIRQWRCPQFHRFQSLTQFVESAFEIQSFLLQYTDDEVHIHILYPIPCPLPYSPDPNTGRQINHCVGTRPQ